MNKLLRLLFSIQLVAIISGCAEPPPRPQPMVTYDAHYWLQQDCASAPVPVQDVCIRYHTGAGMAPGETWATRHSSGPPEGAPEHHAMVGPTEWANVPCDIVVDSRRADCLAEHERLGIDPNVSASQATAESSPPDVPPASCGYAGNGYRPIVDLNGVDLERYECDLVDCQGYASRINPAQNAAAGAVGGAILGAAIGALIGDRSSFARFGAGVGAVQGGVAGAAGSVAAQVNVVRNCMVERGYRVLQ